jgi:hypothetical protein
MIKILRENPVTRLKKILTGYDNKVRTFGIITSDNSMGKPMSSAENLKRRNEFKDILKKSNISYIQLSAGMYGGKEQPYFIINPSLTELKHWGSYQVFNQESFIYGEKTNENTWDIQYWQKKEGPTQFRKLDTVDNFNLFDPDRKDFYTQMKGWKFNFPFPIFEKSVINLILQYNSTVNNLSDSIQQEYQKILKSILFEDKTGSHKYLQRVELKNLLDKGTVL